MFTRTYTAAHNGKVYIRKVSLPAAIAIEIRRIILR